MPASPALLVRDENEMRDLGARLIAACDRGGVITLKGELGTGKTTLVRGALEAEGITSGVRSPTYTLIEYYPLERFAVAHFDLYRLAEAEEFEYLGYRDYMNPATLCFIEWPQRAGDYLQAADLEIEIEYDPEGRRVRLTAKSDWGRQLVSRLK
ncbi:MAG: tRNA (adenosine(37)-N6)-threonylcarbamoyltransferase complex ATPase subunit type 1 TsaE [Gammaproteobacteria bacterium]|nr:tRNA (adenosine(37)-N6)-threonylcarbamoyltransferase complex ATPase subunit type 1 TsaE [Gammaproteobacteria bacterium]